VFNQIAELAYKHKLRVLLFAAALTLPAAIFGLPVSEKLKASVRDFQNPAAESSRTDTKIEELTKQDQLAGFVVVVDSKGDAKSSVQTKRQVQEIAKKLSDLRYDTGKPVYQGVSTYYSSKSPALLSKDGRYTVVAGQVSGTTGVNSDTIEEVKTLLAEYKNVYLTGGDPVRIELEQKTQRDLKRSELIAIPLLLILSVWVFRSFLLALLPVLVGGTTIPVTFLLLRLIDQQVVGLSVFALNLVTGLGLALGIDYSLFMVSRYREELTKGQGELQALRTTLRTAGRTVFFSALTVSAALASLLVFPLKFLYSVGVGGMLCSLVAAFMALLLLPPILALMGKRVDLLSPKFLRKKVEREATQEQGGWYRLAQLVMRRPGLTALLSAAAMLVAALPFTGIKFGSADARSLPASSEVRQGGEILEREFPSNVASATKVLVTAKATKPPISDTQLHQVREKIAKLKGVTAVSKGVKIGSDTWQVDVLSSGGSYSDVNRELIDKIRRLDSSVKLSVTGSTALFVDRIEALKDRIPLAVLILATTMFIILFVFTGSVVLPIKALLMNLLTVVSTFGILVLIFQDGRFEGLLDYVGTGTIEATQPMLLFAVAFGLSTDYGVFLLARISEARREGCDDRTAVAVGLERSGRVVTAAAFLFCVTIAVFATSGITFMKILGIGTAVAVALDATVVRALLVPSLMVMLGKWNWWAPAPLRRLHQRIGIKEE